MVVPLPSKQIVPVQFWSPAPNPYSPAVEAVDLKSTKRWFKSNYGYVPIAQSVEQQTFNLWVLGSNPSGDTKPL